jgi:hypothetical protein
MRVSARAAMLALAIASSFLPAVRAEDFRYRDPAETTEILLAIARLGRLNLIIGPGVEGRTRYVELGRTHEQALVDVAVGSGHTIRKQGSTIAVMRRGSSPTFLTRRYAGLFRPDSRVTLRFPRPVTVQRIVDDVCRQTGVRNRIDGHVEGCAVVLADQATPREILNLLCETMDLDWGPVWSLVAVAPRARLDHYLIEMQVDGRRE